MLPGTYLGGALGDIAVDGNLNIGVGYGGKERDMKDDAVALCAPKPVQLDTG